MALDPQKQKQLHEAKLRVLSRDLLSVEIDEVDGLTEGAIGVGRSPAGVAVSVCLVESGPSNILGKALVASSNSEAELLHLLCVEGAELIARRAHEFTIDITVERIETSASTTTGFRAVAGPHDFVDLDAETLGLAADIIAAGAEPVVEHGVLIGEVRGLEVMRVERVAGDLELRIGIGDFDRDMFGMINGTEVPMSAITDVVSTVAMHRAPGADPHPLNRLGAERLLRSSLIEDPARIGLDSLAVAEPPLPRSSVKDVVPAVSIGRRADVEVVVVVSTGIDLELVPFAADARSRIAPGAPLILVMPERDAHRVTRELAGSLRLPAEIVVVDNDWRGWTGGSVARRA